MINRAAINWCIRVLFTTHHCTVIALQRDGDGRKLSGSKWTIGRGSYDERDLIDDSPFNHDDDDDENNVYWNELCP